MLSWILLHEIWKMFDCVLGLELFREVNCFIGEGFIISMIPLEKKDHC